MSELPKPKKPETILLYESQSFTLTPEMMAERRRAFVRFVAVGCMAVAVTLIAAMESRHIILEPDVTAARWLRNWWWLYLGATVQAIAGAWLWAKYGER